jgi:hypothetical protein
MKRRLVVLGIVSLALVLVAPPPAYADNTVSATDDGQRLDLSLEIVRQADGTIIGAICHATNHRIALEYAKFILASSLCEFRDGSGNWTTFGGQTATSSRQNSRTSGTASAAGPVCSNHGTGTFPMRARVDGYWIGQNDQRHDFRDSGRLYSTSPYPVADCNHD